MTLVVCDELCCVCQRGRVGLHSSDNPSRHEQRGENHDRAKRGGTRLRTPVISVSDLAAKPPSGTPAERTIPFCIIFNVAFLAYLQHCIIFMI